MALILYTFGCLVDAPGLSLTIPTLDGNKITLDVKGVVDPKTTKVVVGLDAPRVKTTWAIRRSYRRVRRDVSKNSPHRGADKGVAGRRGYTEDIT